MIVNRDSIRSSARMAGSVRRYHTWPTIQQQTNADHTWHVMRIFWEIFGDMRPQVSSHILWHDAGEAGGAGDIPFPAKRDCSALAEPVRRLEEEALVRVAGRAALAASAQLTDVERLQCKICDMMEMAEFGVYEIMLGSRLALPIVLETSRSVLDMARRLDSVSEQRRVRDHLLRTLSICGMSESTLWQMTCEKQNGASTTDGKQE